MAAQVTVGLLVRFDALPGKEADVEAFLQGGRELVEREPDTARWFAFRLGPSSFGIFDAFPDDTGRQAHLSGAVAAALAEVAGELIEAPAIEPVEIIAEKPPV